MAAFVHAGLVKGVAGREKRDIPAFSRGGGGGSKGGRLTGHFDGVAGPERYKAVLENAKGEVEGCGGRWQGRLAQIVCSLVLLKRCAKK